MSENVRSATAIGAPRRFGGVGGAQGLEQQSQNRNRSGAHPASQVSKLAPGPVVSQFDGGLGDRGRENVTPLTLDDPIDAEELASGRAAQTSAALRFFQIGQRHLDI